MLRKFISLLLLFFSCLGFVFAQTNSKHIRVSGYTRKDGTYVQPYFRTAPNSTLMDNFSTKGNVNPYTGKPGWINPNSKYNTFYYDTYSYVPKSLKSNFTKKSTLPIEYKNRTYVEDEFGEFTCYLTVKDEKTFNIYDMNDNLILYLVINHRGDWRIFDENLIYIKTIFISTEK